MRAVCAPSLAQECVGEEENKRVGDALESVVACPGVESFQSAFISWNAAERIGEGGVAWGSTCSRFLVFIVFASSRCGLDLKSRDDEIDWVEEQMRYCTSSRARDGVS